MQNNYNQQEDGTVITTINNIQPERVNEEISSYNSVRDLFQDDQMFRMDCDPTFFDSMSIEENFSNNIGLEQIKDLEIIYSDNWVPAAADDEIYSELPDSLFEHEVMEKKEPSPPTSPIPALQLPVIEEEKQAMEVKPEKSDFDLIKYIIFGEVC